MASEAQNNANRENAQKSNGPTTQAGFDRCRNASVTHGLTATLIPMSTDDKQAYEKSIKNTFLRLHPVTDSEIAMVQFIADHEWKLARAFVYEQGLVAKTRADAKNSFGPDYCDPDERDLIVLGHIQEKNSKAFLNMSGELARVQRVVKASIAEYEKVRRVRELIETAQRNTAMQSILGKSSDPVVKHPTVGTLYPFPFLIARLEFVNAVGRQNVFAFDRVWTDPKVKPPSVHFDWGEFAAKMAA